MNHVHRSTTNFKQKNKPFKSGRHSTKGDLIKKQKGRVGATKGVSVKLQGRNSKQDRRNADRLAQKKKKEELVNSLRGIGNKNAPPRILGLVPLGNTANTTLAKNQLLNVVDHPADARSANPLTFVDNAQRRRFTVFESQNALLSVLDTAKVSDVIVFVVNIQEGVSDLGEHLISVLKAQGIPPVIVVVHGLNEVPIKYRNEQKQSLIKYIHSKFPSEPKVVAIDTPMESSEALRFIGNLKVSPIHWREKHAYLLAEGIEYVPSTENAGFGTLVLSGYLRGMPVSANQLVHIPDWGDFQLAKVETIADPYTFQKHKASTDFFPVVDTPDPSRVESLQMDNAPDPNSENFVPDDTDFTEVKTRKKLVPRGTSSYQAAWILEEDSDDEDDEEKDNDMADGDQLIIDTTDGVVEADDEEEEDEESLVELEGNEYVPAAGEEGKSFRMAPSEVGTTFNIEDAPTIGEGKTKKQLQADDEMWPDEVDTPMEVPARVRFQKYRGLKSFRTSPWDPNENLPLDYSRIFQFENIARATKRVLEEAHQHPVPCDTPVRLHIADVAASLAEKRKPGMPFIVFGLLKYENKMSVLNFQIMKHPLFEEPLESKAPLMIHVGFRRFRAQPIFSQHNANCDKHKYERFLHDSRPSVATIYGPITFPPVPTLFFQEEEDQSLALVATGSLRNIDPNRIALKKSVLTGHPYKIHKRTAVIRDMFYNTEDIRWFKPVELFTKYGRAGHIIDSLGTHGHMKVQFDGGLHSNDTICMNLYKRVFPKWNTVVPVPPRVFDEEVARVGKQRFDSDAVSMVGGRAHHASSSSVKSAFL